MLEPRLPRVVSVKQKTLSGDDVERLSYLSNVAGEARSLVTDHEVRVLILWAIVSPLAALAYLIWTKYENIKWFAIPLFLVSIVQFAFQWGGVYQLLSKFLGAT
ncbi:hypothetical protein HY994_04510 [Candidatus Micrarchaeota archaeon]|nr:hypothetical protein [Candidatus Micrarchaeota archaeon]